MSPNRPIPKGWAQYAALSQVGLEMVAPIGMGAALDYYLEWTAPWTTVIGAVVGLVGGMAHLVAILNRRESVNSEEQQREKP
jgi:F0F1-type ATP synthase assembly protein I